MKKLIIPALIGLAVAGFACRDGATESGSTSGTTLLEPGEKLSEASKALSDRLDALEEDWIRLKADAQGKSKVQAELDVLKDDIDDGLSDTKDKIESIGDGASESAQKVKEEVSKKLDELEHSIESLRSKVG